MSMILIVPERRRGLTITYNRMTGNFGSIAAAQPELTEQEHRCVLAHLRQRYANVFTDDAIESHIRDYVGYTFADAMVPIVSLRTPASGKILDIGSGFGSFVLRARQKRFDAVGIELAPFEVKVARQRLRRIRPDDDPESVYRIGDIRTLGVAAESVDTVTLWNVLEHVDDASAVLRSTWHMLRPDGWVYVICPNYAAFRQEAHYHVPWYPLFPRWLASRYLRQIGRDPTYFENEIFYRTNWGVLRSLKRIGFELHDFSGASPLRLCLTGLRRQPKHFLDYYNPFRESVVLSARKPVVKGIKI
jgi:2-polyprenyl-3-methyl-5-hydroxy-6-metoxy-1,4-benzoquinol methylase